MNCSSVEPLIGAALDGELEPSQQFQISEHLENCLSCKTAYRDLEQLQEDIRSRATYHRAPDPLMERLRTSIREEHNPSVRRAQPPWKWMAIAASVLLLLSIGGNLLLSKRGVSENQLIAQEVLSEHVRAMLTNHQVDVISSDRHTVKPWFGDKLDFSPDVKDLAARGFPLVGGRVEYIGQRPVAALVFQRSKHVISLFTWPAGSSVNGVRSQNGYHLVAWNKDGMAYWAISDLSLDDLELFSRLYGG
ncbi:MAG TPA: anti-sigma factor [Terriglobales bacterium]|nr:anti-sigma factor [Terriglobales bacterium]